MGVGISQVGCDIENAGLGRLPGSGGAGTAWSRGECPITRSIKSHIITGIGLCTRLTTYKYTGQQVPIVSTPCADVVAICQPLGQTSPGEKYVDGPHPCGRHSLVFPGPRLAQKSSSLMLRTQKLLRHSPGGVKVVVRGRGDPVVVVMVAYVTENTFEMSSTDRRSKEIKFGARCAWKISWPSIHSARRVEETHWRRRTASSQ